MSVRPSSALVALALALAAPGAARAQPLSDRPGVAAAISRMFKSPSGVSVAIGTSRVVPLGIS